MTVIPPPQESSLEVHTLTKQQAQDLVEQIKKERARLVEQTAQLVVDQEDFGSLVGLAYRGRAWLALGYSSWEELAEEEFSGARFFDSVTARRERVQALVSEGLSTRAIGVVLGVGKDTAHRDALATVAAATVAKPVESPGTAASAVRPAGHANAVGMTSAPPAVRSQGLDGKERQRKRATTAEQAARAMKVAQRRADGWTQEEIAEEVGVSQRTISSDDRLVQAWRADLSAGDLKRLDAGEMSREELAERANLDIVQRDRRRLQAGARDGARALADGLRFLGESVVYADAWLEERAETSAILAGPLANVAGESAEWMALEFDFDDVPDDDLQLLSDDLGRATEWAHQARRRLAAAAETRGVEIDPDGFREELEAKVEARRGHQ